MVLECFRIFGFYAAGGNRRNKQENIFSLKNIKLHYRV